MVSSSMTNEKVEFNPLYASVALMHKLVNWFALCVATKGFMTAIKAFIKPFEAPQRANQLNGFYMRATLALNGLTSTK